MISVYGLQELLDRLAGLDVAAAQQAALESAARALETELKETLICTAKRDRLKRTSSGAELCGTITHTVDSDQAVVGSDSVIAVDEELGTSRTPPHSFMLAVAQTRAEHIVQIAANLFAQGLGVTSD